MITKGKTALIFLKFLPTYTIRNCMEISEENLCVDIGAQSFEKVSGMKPYCSDNLSIKKTHLLRCFFGIPEKLSIKSTHLSKWFSACIALLGFHALYR